MKRALITGVTGQDGSYLAEFLLEQGYKVIGMVRRTSTVNFDRIKHIQDDIELAQGDLLDQISLIDIMREHRPQGEREVPAHREEPRGQRRDSEAEQRDLVRRDGAANEMPGDALRQRTV